MRTLALLLVLAVAAVPAAAQQPTPASATPQPPGAPVHQLRAVETMPRLANLREFRLALARLYPSTARAAGMNGWVNVRFIVEADGSVSDPVVMSSTDERFEQPTLEAVRTMRFRPARLAGRPVRVWVIQPIQWSVYSGEDRQGTRDPRLTNPERDWRPTLSDRLYGPNRPYPPTPASGDPPPPPFR